MGLPGPQGLPQALALPSLPVREQRLPELSPKGSPTARLSGDPRESRRGEQPSGLGLRGEGPGEAVGEGRGVSSMNVVISSRKKPGPRGGPPPDPRTPLSRNWRRLAKPPPSASSSSSSSSSLCPWPRYSGGPPRARLWAGSTRISSDDDHLCRKEPGARGVEKMLVSSWDNRRDKGTWEEEQVRPGGAAETKVEVAETKVGDSARWFTRFHFSKAFALAGKPGTERSEGSFLPLGLPSSAP